MNSILKPAYHQHQPDKTLLYQLVKQYYPEFNQLMEAQGKTLPGYVQKEFDAFLKCGRLEHGFLRAQCDTCHHEKLVAFSCKKRGFCPSCGARRMAESAALLVDDILPHEPIRQWVLSFPFQLRFLFATYPNLMGDVLGIVFRTLSTHLIHKAGFKKSQAQTGAVTLIQRFGSALNLNVHFHILMLDGVYTEDEHQQLRFRQTKAPTKTELEQLVHTLSHRIARFLERKGLLERDMENSWLTLDEEVDEALSQIHGSSITYRIACGPNAGKKVFTLQTLPSSNHETTQSDRVAKTAGFSLHAGVAAARHQRDKLERLARYISRPAVSEKRLSITANNKIRYELKTPYRDGTTHVFFEPLDYIARLAALIPKPRVNLTRYHGVFAPNNKLRSQITPAKRGKFSESSQASEATDDLNETKPLQAMTWMQRLKRVFNINIENCEHCGGKLKVIACIDNPLIIQQILKHLEQKNTNEAVATLPEGRAPPNQQTSFLFS